MHLPKSQLTVRLFMVSTAERQWLEHLRKHENMFETVAVRANGCKRQVRRYNVDIFSFFFNTKVCCVFS